jgi:hypothetical protein
MAVRVGGGEAGERMGLVVVLLDLSPPVLPFGVFLLAVEGVGQKEREWSWWSCWWKAPWKEPR